MAIDTRNKMASATQMPWMVLQPIPSTGAIDRYDQTHTTGYFSALDIYEPYFDCSYCYYTMTVSIGGGFADPGTPGASCSCLNYIGVHTVTREGDACNWSYYHPAGDGGWYSKLTMDAYGWKFTLYASDGTVCARWRLPTYAQPDCPVGTQWYWVGGYCDTGTLVTVEQTLDSPIDPPEWYHEDLLGVLRYWQRWA